MCRAPDGCSDRHGGTSAAAPNAAGVLALVLEANGNRATWRDVQHLIVHGARVVDPTDADWVTNGAGHKVNHKYGYGILDADATSAVAKTWVNVGPQIISTFGPFTCVWLLPPGAPAHASLTRTVPPLPPPASTPRSRSTRLPPLRLPLVRAG